MADLEGKRAIVTGASSGIGAATARALAAEGARVVGGARRVERLETDVALELDVHDPRAARGSSEASGRRLDILVNTAGLSRSAATRSGSRPRRTSATVIETNVHRADADDAALRPAPRCDGGGHIVNIGSVAGIWAYPNGASYIASKFAVHGYTRALRDDLHGKPDPRHERRARARRDGVLERALQRRRGEGEPPSTRTSRWAGRCTADDVADCIMFAVTRPAAREHRRDRRDGDRRSRAAPGSTAD